MFIVDGNIFDRYIGDGVSPTLRKQLATGLFVAIEDSTCRAMVAYVENGIVRCMPYSEFFAPVTTHAGERPLFMPITTDAYTSYPFNDGGRQWDPALDLGMHVR